MDTVDGKTLNIFSGDLIMDTETVGYKVKNTIYDFWDDFTSRVKEKGQWFWVIIGAIVLVVIIIVVIKFSKWLTKILAILPDKKDKNQNKRE